MLDSSAVSTSFQNTFIRKLSLCLLIPVLLLSGVCQAAEVMSRVEGEGLIARNPEDPAAYIIFSKFLLTQGEIKEAQAILETGRSKAHPSADLLVELCKILESQEQTSHAEIVALNALEIDPKHVEANICLGELFFKMGWQQSGLEAFERAVFLDPEGSRTMVKLLGGLMTAGEIQSAENRCHEFLATNPADVDLWLSLGKIFEKQEKRQPAFATYGQVLTIDPQNSRAFSRQGRLFCEFGQYAAAESACLRALEFDSNNGLAHAYLAIAYSHLGNNDKALGHAQFAEDQGYNMTVVWKKIGR